MVGQDDFLLGADGHLKQRALEEFAYLGVHQMTVIGKAVVRGFYGAAPKYSYFSGCSTGGRQGQAEVQRYPDDYEGVLSGAPAINWAHFGAAGLWPVAVTRSLGSVVQCKFDAAHRAAVAACDGSDGLRDGLVASIGICHFNPQSLVGTKTSCGVIGKRDAEVIKLIWDGPRQGDGTRLWNGIDPAALIHAPEEAATWAAPFFDGRIPDQGRFSYADFEKSYEHLVERYGTVMDTSNPNLLDFPDRGGKTIIWQGVADDLIPAEGSVHYFESIRRTLGDEATGRFLRLYLAPGVRHCMGGDGPQPVGLLTPLIDWVEKGRAPTIVRSQNVDDRGRVTRTRPLCPYPLHAHYAGSGSVDDAVNFRCQR